MHLDGRQVLFDISWSLERGRQWAFVGPNGSGKSTLLRLIRGDVWLDRDGGTRRYALDGREQSVAASAPRIGFVSPELHERYARLRLTISARTLIATGFSDTIYLPAPPSPQQTQAIDALLERFALMPLADRTIGELSFGQLRLALVARALVRAPRVLVLDECANGLDDGARRTLLGVLTSIADDTQIVFASHRAHEVPRSTTDYAMIANGRIVERGAGLPPSMRDDAARSSAGTIESDPSQTARAVASETLIDIRGADVYRGDALVLRDVAWSIVRGEHTMIRGANGAGKSTLAALLAGTIMPAHGAHVRRFGNGGPFDVWELKRRIALVSDDLQIAYDSNPIVERVIASGFVSSIGLMHEPDASEREIVHDLMRRLRLGHLAGRRFRALSFGERRRVLVARSLVHRPDVLILDEVWSGLDAGFRAELASLLHELADGGTTLILISHHDDDVPSFVRRVYAVDGGRVRASSLPA